MDTKWLEDFLTLAETGNFGRAAAARNITQPAFSRRIQSLEQSVGKTLIDRSASPIQLTAEGLLFRTTARNLLKHMQDGLARLHGLSDLGHQAIDFAAAHSLTHPLLPDLLQKFGDAGQLQPSRVEAINVDDSIQLLRKGKCDLLLAFSIEQLMQPPFLSLNLGQSRVIPVCAAEALPVRKGRKPALKKLKPKFSLEQQKIPWLSYISNNYLGRAINHHLSAVKPTLNLQPVVVSSLTSLLRDLAVRGEGVAWLPEYTIAEELQNGLLVPLQPKKHAIELDIVLYRSDVRLHPAAEQFWQRVNKAVEAGWQI
ncbi:LysR family transcriptional regulator [Pelagibaculum spongiae]|uniref:LysR family transcriptional regulator n=1 Tax=Pelagibaculum spongiae TaxID=2080658 RepID=A0A2V1GQ79_9GAMM|nr:LysR family transcriptional regulator [Pelagibaculum spongiae]PVZ65699.1 LysR family transcriptional regulator [Pelagibaculum spongiae]